MLAISAWACARRTSKLTRSSMPCSLRPSKRPFMHTSAPSSGAKYTRPILCFMTGPLDEPPHAESEAAVRKASAAVHVAHIQPDSTEESRAHPRLVTIGPRKIQLFRQESSSLSPRTALGEAFSLTTVFLAKSFTLPQILKMRL